MRRSLTHTVSLAWHLIALLVLIAVLQTPANAGTGTFQNGAYKFVVSVRWNASNSELDEIKAQFRRANSILFEATNGQHYFAEIEIANNSGASDEAEYWILPDTEPGERANSQFNRYGVRTDHVNMYGKHFLGTPKHPSVATQAGRGDWVIVHELGHHSYDLADEYRRPKFVFGIEVGFYEDDKCGPPNQNSYSIMDRDWRPNNGPLITKEFCLGAEHDPDGSNLQSRKHRRYADRSCWNIIANNSDQPYRRAVKPSGSTSPVTNPTPPPLNIYVAANTLPRVVMSVCKNAAPRLSYHTINYGGVVKAGAKTAVDYMVADSSLGIRSFSAPEVSNYLLTRITNPSVRNYLKSAIDGISFVNGTYGVHNDLNNSLTNSLSVITNPGSTRSTVEHVVLVVRGGNGAQIPGTLISSYIQAKVRLNVIYVRAVQDVTDTARLKQVARETGGQYREVSEYAPNRAQPNSYVSTVNTEIVNVIQDINGYRRTSFGTSLPAAGSSPAVMHVEPGAESAYFALQSASDLTGATVSLSSPSGKTYRLRPALTSDELSQTNAAPPTEESSVAQTTYTADLDVNTPNSKAMAISAPEAGDWQLTVTPAAGSTLPEDAEVAAYIKHDGVSVRVNPRLEEVTLAEPIKLQADASYEGEPIITGLTTMSVTITRPDGSQVVADLYDDGEDAHNDDVAGDGIYSALFSDYVGAGIYTIETSVNVPGGVTKPGESLDDDGSTPAATRTVPAFSAAAKATVTVNP